MRWNSLQCSPPWLEYFSMLQGYVHLFTFAVGYSNTFESS